MYLKGENISLRALEPTDLDFVHDIENNETLWELSNTIVPFSKFTIETYIYNANKSVFETGQLRLVICLQDNQTSIGLIDLFDLDITNKRAGVGIVIVSETEKRKGYASEALQLFVNYTFKRLQLHQLYCNILEDNTPSRALFEKHNFKCVGVKKDWVVSGNTYKNELLYQRIN